MFTTSIELRTFFRLLRDKSSFGKARDYFQENQEAISLGMNNPDRIVVTNVNWYYRSIPEQTRNNYELFRTLNPNLSLRSLSLQ